METEIKQSSLAHNHGAWLDSQLSYNTQVSKICQRVILTVKYILTFITCHLSLLLLVELAIIASRLD